MANLRNAYDPDAEGQSDIGKLPTGEYVAQIVESDFKPTSGNTGHYLELTYEVVEGPLKGRKHWERLNLDNPNAKTVEIANRQFASVREATGVPNPIDSHELHYKPHVIRIEFHPAGSEITYGKKKGQKRDRDEAEIRAWKRLDGAVNVAPQAPTASMGAAQNTAPAANGAPPWAAKNAA